MIYLWTFYFIYFYKLVTHVLLYGCEIWGFEALETKVKFLKYIFHVHRIPWHRSIICRTCKMPLRIQVKVRMLRFWSAIISNSEKYSSKIYFVWHYLHKGFCTSSWLHDIKITFVSTGLDCVWQTHIFFYSSVYMHLSPALALSSGKWHGFNTRRDVSFVWMYMYMTVL